MDLENPKFYLIEFMESGCVYYTSTIYPGGCIELLIYTFDMWFGHVLQLHLDGNFVTQLLNMYVGLVTFVHSSLSITHFISSP